VIPAFLRGEWVYNHEKHLFYPYLKKRRSEKKKVMFDPFMESLSRLDPYILEEPSNFLSENGQLCADIDLITEYLCTIQANPEIFLGIIQRQLT
jgi:peptidase E